MAAPDARSRWATRAPASSRRSGRASGRCGRPAGRAVVAGPVRRRAGRAVAGRPWACPDVALVPPPDARTAPPSSRRATASRSCRTAGSARWPARPSSPRRPPSPLPDGVDPAVAALIGCCVSTGVGAVLKTAEVPAGASVAVIGLGGVGPVVRDGRRPRRSGADRGDRPGRGQAGVAREVGATDGILAGDDPAATIAALRDLTDGGPDFVFEAIGRPATVELAIECLPLGGTAVLVGMTPVEARASFAVYPFVDGSRRILGSNYGFADPPVDFPRYAALHLAGRLPSSG